jgi:hypothetical protein
VWSRLAILCAVVIMAASIGAAAAPAHAQPAALSNAQSARFQLAGVVPKNSAEQFELAFWNSVKDSKQVSDYEAYLHAYPKGRFAALARARNSRPPSRPGPPRTSRPASRRKRRPIRNPSRARHARRRLRPTATSRKGPQRARPAPWPRSRIAMPVP